MSCASSSDRSSLVTSDRSSDHLVSGSDGKSSNVEPDDVSERMKRARSESLTALPLGLLAHSDLLSRRGLLRKRSHTIGSHHKSQSSERATTGDKLSGLTPNSIEISYKIKRLLRDLKHCLEKMATQRDRRLVNNPLLVII